MTNRFYAETSFLTVSKLKLKTSGDNFLNFSNFLKCPNHYLSTCQKVNSKFCIDLMYSKFATVAKVLDALITDCLSVITYLKESSDDFSQEKTYEKTLKKTFAKKDFKFST